MGSVIKEAPRDQSAAEDEESPLTTIIPRAPNGWIDGHERGDRQKQYAKWDQNPLAIRAFA